MTPDQAVPPETTSILIVDDFDPWRRSASMTLVQADDCVVIGEAANGSEAVQKAKEIQPDVILLDIGLPILNGIEAAEQIRNVAPNAKVLIVSQTNDADVVGAALRNGAHGYVLKADARNDLLPAIDAILRGETFVSGRLKN